MNPTLKTKMIKKTYNLFTHPEFSGIYIENRGDRTFKVYGEFNGYRTCHVAIGEDRDWEITDANLQLAANAIFQEMLDDEDEGATTGTNITSDSGDIWESFNDVFKKMDDVFKKAFGSKKSK